MTREGTRTDECGSLRNAYEGTEPNEVQNCPRVYRGELWTSGKKWPRRGINEFEIEANGPRT